MNSFGRNTNFPDSKDVFIGHRTATDRRFADDLARASTAIADVLVETTTSSSADSNNNDFSTAVVVQMLEHREVPHAHIRRSIHVCKSQGSPLLPTNSAWLVICFALQGRPSLGPASVS